MNLTRHHTPQGPRWALDGKYLPQQFSLELLLELPKDTITNLLQNLPTTEPATGSLLPPIEVMHEVWASGVTYLRSRQARESESVTGDVYEKVYNAERPELFFKALGWRVAGPNMSVRIRSDSAWNVPEPELTLVINAHREIMGYCIGNDVSSRDIEGANPLYLPQAKIYNGSCALGPGILLTDTAIMRDLPVYIEITRATGIVFKGETSISQMKRSLEELATHLMQEMDFPHGVFLMTGTGIVPPDDFTLHSGDTVRISIAPFTLENKVA